MTSAFNSRMFCTPSFRSCVSRSRTIPVVPGGPPVVTKPVTPWVWPTVNLLWLLVRAHSFSVVVPSLLTSNLNSSQAAAGRKEEGKEEGSNNYNNPHKATLTELQVAWLQGTTSVLSIYLGSYHNHGALMMRWSFIGGGCEAKDDPLLPLWSRWQ